MGGGAVVSGSFLENLEGYDLASLNAAPMPQMRAAHETSEAVGVMQLEKGVEQVPHSYPGRGSVCPICHKTVAFKYARIHAHAHAHAYTHAQTHTHTHTRTHTHTMTRLHTKCRP